MIAKTAYEEFHHRIAPRTFQDVRLHPWPAEVCGESSEPAVSGEHSAGPGIGKPIEGPVAGRVAPVKLPEKGEGCDGIHGPIVP